MDKNQLALAAEIRSQMAARTPRITAKAMQDAVGISSSTWANYFVQCERDVPVSVIIAVAEVLGMKGSELLDRAEARAAETGDVAESRPVPKEIAAMLSKDALKDVQRKQRKPARKPSTTRRTGT